MLDFEGFSSQTSCQLKYQFHITINQSVPLLDICGVIAAWQTHLIVLQLNCRLDCPIKLLK